MSKWPDCRKEVGALFYHEHDPHDQNVIRAAHDGREPGAGDQELYIVTRDYSDGSVTEYAVHICTFDAATCAVNPFMTYTVEDYGNRYRVRGDGRNDRWHTVRL